MPSLMTNENVRLYWHDRFVAPLFCWIPKFVVPNHLTVFRFGMTPVVLWLLFSEKWMIATIAFLIAAFSDVLDGTLARTRKQITTWGTLADPIADKILIGSVAITMIFHGLSYKFAFLILSSEAIVLTSVWIWRLRGGQIVSANWFGKIKMLLQCIGTMLLFASIGFHVPWAHNAAVAAFSVSMVLALCSAYMFSL